MTVPVSQPIKPETGGKGTKGLVNYSNRPSKEGDVLWFKLTHKDDGSRQIESNIERTEHQIDLQDIRTANRDFSLLTNGFVLRNITVPEGIDWESDAEIKKKYYPVVEELLKKETGASRVHIFDHTERKGHIDPNSFGGVNANNNSNPRGPVPVAHVDYTLTSGWQRLDALLPEEAEKLRETPFAVVQAWKPLVRPVQSSPLGMIDAATVSPKDFSVNELRLPDRTGLTLSVHQNPSHRWYYTSEQTPEEAYLFVCYDSRSDRARFTPHSGFKDLSTKEGAPERESIEIRAYVFWENEPKSKIELDY